MNNRQKPLLEAALICFILAVVIMAFITTINAEKAPPNDAQHWQLLIDGDMAYLLTKPGCNLTEQELGEDSRLFTLECDQAKDGE